MGRRTVVVAIGGNSLIKDAAHQSVEDQYEAAGDTVRHLVPLVRDGWDVVIGHGNGPQVGFILRRSELARHELHEVPLDVCGADSQGAIGYALQQQLHNEFGRLGLEKQAVTVVTQVEVDPHDKAFARPTKPIGSFMKEDEAAQRRDVDGWTVKEERSRGWRRVVPSPAPLRIVEEGVIRSLVEAGFVVIGVGGGGIPVVRDADGALHGVAAVIDKDLAASLLATVLGAELLVISTGVPAVALDFGRLTERFVDRLTIEEAEHHLADGQFPEGSMGPKIRAAMGYLERGGGEAVITSPDHIEEAASGSAGTRIVRS
jgi:carbamate kinase